MSERQFFEPQARNRVCEAIKAVEAQTSAELVVAVRRQASTFRHVDLAVGSIAAFAALLVLLFHPFSFAVEWMPVEVALAFLVGAAVSANSWTHKRWLVRDKVIGEATWRAACASFHEKRITATSGRNGIFVFVSMLERRVEIVTDIGVDPDALGAEWGTVLEGIRGAIRRGPDLDRFIESLKLLGPVLGAAMPRAQDDVNELPDEPDVS